MDKHTQKRRIWAEAKKRPLVFAVYCIVRLIVIVSLAAALLRRDFESAFTCVLVLVLFMIPLFLERSLAIKLPTTLEIIILLFIFAAEILGELQCYFIQYPNWDTMLHTTSGFLCAAVGFSLIDILNRDSKIKFSLSPVYVAIVAFCFSMTIGVLWEFFEFGMDWFFHSDMQKDTVVNAIYTVELDPTRTNKVVAIKGIQDVLINGQSLGLGGYLDIGLIDTMKDLFVNFIGAVVFSVTGFFYAKSKGARKSPAQSFVPSKKTEETDYLKQARVEDSAEEAPEKDE